MEIKNNYKKVISLKENLFSIIKDGKSVLSYDLEANSSACLFFCDYSGAITEINVNLDANSSCELYGIFKNTNENTNIITNVTHNGNNSKCDQDFRFINKNSISSFKGLISVPRKANNCESHMTNKNLLLDNTSQAFAKPELDIKNSNVVCTHSSTTGTLDEDQIFYIQSRGLSYEESVNMLVEAFYQDIKNKITSAQIG